MKPVVLSVCVKNGGKSQIAAALMRQIAGDQVEVHSAGTAPGSSLNAAAQASVETIGATFADEAPKPVDADVVQRAARVIVVGTEADPAAIGAADDVVDVWDVIEPSNQGVDGDQRMALVRNDIAQRVALLHRELTGAATSDVHVYEPALCCNTGVCGPDLDDELVACTANIDAINAAGGSAARHNLANDPTAFTENDGVTKLLHATGTDQLPATTVDGLIVQTGSYLDRDSLARLAGVTIVDASAPAPRANLLAADADADASNETSSGCCQPTNGCC